MSSSATPKANLIYLNQDEISWNDCKQSQQYGATGQRIAICKKSFYPVLDKAKRYILSVGKLRADCKRFE